MGIDKNSLYQNNELAFEIITALYRYEQLNCVYTELCSALEAAHISFIPLKGSILRKYYPEPWMRTSCDIDILVRKEELDGAVKYLTEKLGYKEGEHATHDVSLFTPGKVHVELHFDLVEEGRANASSKVLNEIWNNVSVKKGYSYFYEMSDAFFYFYHIAHMAKHFETGGCGIRPFIDLWLLDQIDGADRAARDELLKKGDLLRFAEVAKRLSRCWIEDEMYDETSRKIETFILSGGVYGSIKNKVALQQQKKGGRIGYLISRIFIPVKRLKYYYPILEKYPILAPIMQVRRWFMLLSPRVAKMAKSEISSNRKIDKAVADDMKMFLSDIGLI